MNIFDNIDSYSSFTLDASALGFNRDFLAGFLEAIDKVSDWRFRFLAAARGKSHGKYCNLLGAVNAGSVFNNFILLNILSSSYTPTASCCLFFYYF